MVVRRQGRELPVHVGETLKLAAARLALGMLKDGAPWRGKIVLVP